MVYRNQLKGLSIQSQSNILGWGYEPMLRFWSLGWAHKYQTRVEITDSDIHSCYYDTELIRAIKIYSKGAREAQKGKGSRDYLSMFESAYIPYMSMNLTGESKS